MERLDDVESDFTTKSGGTCQLLASVDLIVIAGESYTLTAMLDITERKKMEDQLRQMLAELVRWQEVMLGREDRVRELKKEVNDLLARYGQSALPKSGRLMKAPLPPDESQRAEGQLRLAAAVFESIRDGVVITDTAPRILAINSAYREITGYTEEEARGQNPSIP